MWNFFHSRWVWSFPPWWRPEERSMAGIWEDFGALHAQRSSMYLIFHHSFMSFLLVFNFFKFFQILHYVSSKYWVYWETLKISSLIKETAISLEMNILQSILNSLIDPINNGYVDLIIYFKVITMFNCGSHWSSWRRMNILRPFTHVNAL